MSDHTEVLKEIERLESVVPHGNFYKVHETFVLYAAGDRIQVQVLDQGTDDDYRYIVHARNETTGRLGQNSDGEATPLAALEEFHWRDVVRPIE